MSLSPVTAVIGAGIGGLAIAARLAARGYEVHVYERNSGPGGKLSHFEKEGFSFDEGPSLFTEPSNLEKLFAECGARLEDYFSYRPLPESCRYFYEDGTRFTASTRPEEFAHTLSEKNGEDPTRIEQFLRNAAGAYETLGSLFLNYPIHQPSSLPLTQLPGAISRTRLSYLWQSMDAFHRKSFRHPRTVQLFNRFATYNGSNPYKAPSMLHMIAALEQVQGTFYPEGGMVSIPQAVYRLAVDKGVHFHFRTPVDKIIVHNGRVEGLVIAGKNHPFGRVVSNSDVYYVYQHLLNEPARARKILKQERSSSAIIFYWGIKQLFPELGLHNIFFSADYFKEFEHLFRGSIPYSDPTVYVNITAKQEPGRHAPEGMENWFVMVNVPAHRGQDWPVITTQLRRQVCEKLSRMLGVDISPLIVTEEVLTPEGIDRKTGSHTGSLYGTSSNSALAAFRRHANETSLKNIWFTGGSVHPGGGIPLCLKSASIVARQILKLTPDAH